MVEFDVWPSRPLYLSTDVVIQVVLFGIGALKDQVTYTPYLVPIPDVTVYCPAYVIKYMPGTEGVALLVAQTKANSELTIDGQALGGPARMGSWARQ